MSCYYFKQENNNSNDDGNKTILCAMLLHSVYEGPSILTHTQTQTHR